MKFREPFIEAQRKLTRKEYKKVFPNNFESNDGDFDNLDCIYYDKCPTNDRCDACRRRAIKFAKFKDDDKAQIFMKKNSNGIIESPNLSNFFDSRIETDLGFKHIFAVKYDDIKEEDVIYVIYCGKKILGIVISEYENRLVDWDVCKGVDLSKIYGERNIIDEMCVELINREITWR